MIEPEDELCGEIWFRPEKETVASLRSTHLGFQPRREMTRHTTMYALPFTNKLEEVPPAAPVDQTLACLRREDKIKCVKCSSQIYSHFGYRSEEHTSELQSQ